MTTYADLTRSFYDQDSRWAHIVERAIEQHSTAAHAVTRFLRAQWEPFFRGWLQFAAHRTGTDDVTRDVLEPLLGAVHYDLYPSARVVGFPDTSFLLPDVTLGTPQAGTVMSTNYQAPFVGRSHDLDPVEIEINNLTDAEFWRQTEYKPGQKLDPRDPQDQAMVNTWLAIRFAVATEWAQNEERARIVNARGHAQPTYGDQIATAATVSGQDVVRDHRHGADAGAPAQITPTQPVRDHRHDAPYTAPAPVPAPVRYDDQRPYQWHRPYAQPRPQTPQRYPQGRPRQGGRGDRWRNRDRRDGCQGWHGRGGYYRNGSRYPGRWWRNEYGFPVWLESDVNLQYIGIPVDAELAALPPPTLDQVPIAADAAGQPDADRIDPGADDGSQDQGDQGNDQSGDQGNDQSQDQSDDGTLAHGVNDASVSGGGHGGHGRRRRGGSRGFGGGYGWDGYGYGYDGDDGDTNVTNVALISGDPGSWWDRTPDEQRLVSLAPVVTPGVRGLSAKLALDGNILRASICIDGACYQGQTDLTAVFDALAARLDQWHAQSHGQIARGSNVSVGASNGQSLVGKALVGGGSCGAHTYTHVDRRVLAAILKRLEEKGCEISGNNPWHVVTHDHGVECDATWHESATSLVVEVTDSDFTAPCAMIWDTLDGYLQDVGAHAAIAHETPYAAYNDAVAISGRTLIGALAAHHEATYAAGWFDSITDAVKAVGGGIKDGVLAVKHGIDWSARKLKPAMVAVATGVATAYGGPLAGAAAAKITGPIIDMSHGTDEGDAADKAKATADAAAHIAQAHALAAQSPQAAHALADAKRAATATIVAYHGVQTVANAAAGNKDAKKQVVELATSALGGDKASQELVDLIKKVTQKDDQWTPPSLIDASSWGGSGSGSSDASASAAVPDDATVASGAIALMGAAAATWRDAAQAQVRRARASIVGYVKPNGNPPQVRTFANVNQADDWYGQWLGLPHAYEYVAYFDKSDPTFPGPLNEQFGDLGEAAIAETVSSGWFVPILTGAGGFAAGKYGERAIDWAREKWDARKRA